MADPDSEKPAILGEYKRRRLGGATASAAESSGQVLPFLRGGGGRVQVFKLFTLAFTGVITASVVLTWPELDAKGREHAFTPLQRFIRKRRDAFFGVKEDE